MNANEVNEKNITLGVKRHVLRESLLSVWSNADVSILRAPVRLPVHNSSLQSSVPYIYI